MEMPMTSSTGCSAEALSFGGLRLINVQITFPMSLCAASIIEFSVGILDEMLTALIPA